MSKKQVSCTFFVLALLFTLNVCSKKEQEKTIIIQEDNNELLMVDNIVENNILKEEIPENISIRYIREITIEEDIPENIYPMRYISEAIIDETAYSENPEQYIKNLIENYDKWIGDKLYFLSKINIDITEGDAWYSLLEAWDNGPSIVTLIKQWIKSFKFNSCIFGSKPPVYFARSLVV